MVLDYIYTDRIDFKEQTDPTGLDRTNLAVCRLMMDVYLLAIQFRIQRLEHLCVQYLEFKITKENVLDALHNSNKMDIGMIKDYCLNFIVKEDFFYDIVMSSDFAILEKQLLVEIIRKRLNPHASKASEAEMKYDKTIGTTLENDMAVFLKSGGKEFCDINLVLDGAVIAAHKSILAARCQYFQGMFRSFNPTDNTVNVSFPSILISTMYITQFLIFRFKLVMSDHLSNHSMLFSSSSTMVIQICPLRTLCICSKLQVSMDLLTTACKLFASTIWSTI